MTRLLLPLVISLCALKIQGQVETTRAGTNAPYLIDLPAALKLAGAQNLDVEIARQKLSEARANYQSAIWQFFPWLNPGIAYRGHDNLIQNVEGRMIEVHKDSYAVGPALVGQLDIGDAIYKKLAAQQLVKASDFALEAQRQDAILAAAHGYFDLVKAAASVEVTRDAVGISTNYAAQVEQALLAGIAFKGDLLRVRVQTEKNTLILRQAVEQQRIAAARLAQTLHLAPMTELLSRDNDLVPVSLVDTNAALDALVAQALGTRPELQQSRAIIEAARNARQGAVYGPLVPSAGAAVFAGGLGGGPDGGTHVFGESEDYLFTLGWRIGPGGLFDQGRRHATESRLEIARLSEKKLLDDVMRQVIEAHAHVESLKDQIATAQRANEAARETLVLSQQRKEFAVGAVLETIQAEQDLTRARLDLLNAILEQNKAQYSLSKAIGKIAAGP